MFFNKKKKNKDNNSYIVKITALLIHAAKIDEKYSTEEEDIIKKTLLDLGSSQNELENIRKDLSTSMGTTIKFDYKIDKELIGGLKLQLGSFMIDTSIKNKLKKLEQRMLED